MPDPWPEEADAFTLCDAVFCKMAEHYGNEVDAQSGTTESRVVTLAYLAMGIIGNGGFAYLFEGDIPGDPNYQLTLDAFRAIGSSRAVEAFEEALGLFPSATPHQDVEQRTDFYQAIDQEKRDRIDTKFFDADDDTLSKLADYIRANRREFENMW